MMPLIIFLLVTGFVILAVVLVLGWLLHVVDTIFSKGSFGASTIVGFIKQFKKVEWIINRKEFGLKSKGYDVDFLNYAEFCFNSNRMLLDPLSYTIAIFIIFNKHANLKTGKKKYSREWR